MGDDGIHSKEQAKLTTASRIAAAAVTLFAGFAAYAVQLLNYFVNSPNSKQAQIAFNKAIWATVVLWAV